MNDSAVDLPDAERLIEGSPKLTSIFGYWPSFHDAEVLELVLDRGTRAKGSDPWLEPLLTMKIVLWELTSNVKPDGYYETRHHSLAEIQFKGVTELSMAGFGTQNAIFGLNLKHSEVDGISSFEVVIDPTMEFGASFKCAAIEVLNAVPCPPEEAVAYRR